ncbi:MAG: hypothetical protein AB1346_11750 [Thermodesulfobacteriota bacterium]
MANPYICGMCGKPILEEEHVEGYHGQMKTWEPLHTKCAEAIQTLAKRTGQEGPLIRDGFAGAMASPKASSKRVA